MPQPQTKNIELVDRINHVLESGTTNLCELDTLKHEALKLRSVSIGEGDMLLGMIASLEGNSAEVRKRFRNAMAYDGQNDVLMFNYGHSLYRLGHFAEAIQVLSKMAEYDKQAARIVACCCLKLGLPAKAKQYCELADCDNIEFDLELSSRQSQIPQLGQIAFAAVRESFKREPAIWKELSTR